MNIQTNRKSGHTLLELLTAMFVMAILIAAAIPFYGQYLIRGKIDAMRSTILLTATAEDRYFSTHKRYEDTQTLDYVGLMNDAFASIPQNINPNETNIHAQPAMTDTGWSYAVLMTMNIDNHTDRNAEECWVYFSSTHPAGYSGQMIQLYNDVTGESTAPSGYSQCESCPTCSPGGGDD